MKHVLACLPMMLVPHAVHAGACEGTPPTWWGPALACTARCSVAVPAPEATAQELAPVFVSRGMGAPSVAARSVRVLEGRVNGRTGVLVEADAELVPGTWAFQWGPGHVAWDVEVLADDPAPLPELAGNVSSARPPCEASGNTAPEGPPVILDVSAEEQEADTAPISVVFSVRSQDRERVLHATADAWLWREGDPQPDLENHADRRVERISAVGPGQYWLAYVDGLPRSTPGDTFNIAFQLVTPGGQRSGLFRGTVTKRGYGCLDQGTASAARPVGAGPWLAALALARVLFRRRRNHFELTT